MSLGDLEERMSSTELRGEVRRLHDELAAVSDENAQLRSQLERLEQEGREQVEALREECRHAKSRVAYLEREGRVEAEIQVEVARLRARNSVTSGGIGADRPRSPRRNRPSPLDPAYDDELDEDDAYESDRDVKTEQYGVTVKQMSAMIREQDQRIKEGNAAYSTLLSEHDELLALLAEVHNIRTSLKRALVQAAGPGAVEDALRSAERMTESQREGAGVGDGNGDAGVGSIAGGSPGTNSS
jgi:predicted  nucleic acid-binding Zn-ribbon protein